MGPDPRCASWYPSGPSAGGPERYGRGGWSPGSAQLPGAGGRRQVGLVTSWTRLGTSPGWSGPPLPHAAPGGRCPWQPRSTPVWPARSAAHRIQPIMLLEVVEMAQVVDLGVRAAIDQHGVGHAPNRGVGPTQGHGAHAQGYEPDHEAAVSVRWQPGRARPSTACVMGCCHRCSGLVSSALCASRLQCLAG